MNIHVEKQGGKIAVHSPYNSLFVKSARKLGGSWSGGCWIFPDHAEELVRESLRKYYGTDGTDEAAMVIVRVVLGLPVAPSAVQMLTFGGFPVAQVFGRDSGAKLGDGVAIVEGGFSSHGSRKNYYLIWSEGTTVQMALPTVALDRLDVHKSVERYDVVGDATPSGKEPPKRTRETVEAEIGELWDRLRALQEELDEL